ncbi:putative pectinesterase [Dioscorea sansibarensis]
MATMNAITPKLSLLLILYIVSMVVSFRVSSSTGEPISSCSQTPYPLVCTTFMNSAATIGATTTPESQDDSRTVTTSSPLFLFLSSALQATVQRAINTHKLASSSMNINTALISTAWSDCLELCEQTISLLNRSIASDNIEDDAQTWISAAMANEQTCLDGFNELIMSAVDEHDQYSTAPFMATNMSEMISNLLAINKHASMMKHSGSRAGGGSSRRLLVKEFPNWVSAVDRRLLQFSSSAVKANLVVAQDGSRDYKEK